MSKIEWTDKTWNPVTGCNKVSTGCKFCYAEQMHKRLQAMGQGKYQQDFLAGAVCHENTLTEPLTWKKPSMVFVNSMSDLFHEQVPFDFIDKVFATMKRTPQHTYQVLTKRPERAVEFFSWASKVKEQQALPNVWLGTSVENQEQANKRIPFLLRCRAAVRFLSCEPLLSELKLQGREFGDGISYNWLNTTGIGNKIDWVIVGGESGRGERPIKAEWVRSLQRQCEAADVSFFFKQWGRLRNNPEQFDPTIDPDHPNHAKGGCQLDGKIYNAFPKPTPVH